MRLKKGWLLVLIAAIVLSTLAAGCQAKLPKQAIIIGVAGPMNFIHGEHHWLGALMAAEEINGAGGITVGDQRYRLELVKIDTNELLSVDDAATAVERAITVDGVQLLVGGIRSEAVFAMQEVAMDHRTIFMVCGAAAPQLAARVAADYDRYKYWFRVTPINSTYLVRASLLLLAHVAGVVRAELGIAVPKVALVIEQAVVGDQLAAAAQMLIPTMGLQVVGIWRPSPTAADMTAELTGIRNSGANIIYTYLSASAGVTYAKQWGELQIPAASVGINVEAQAQGFMAATDGHGDWELTLNTYAPVVITDRTIPFYEKFVERSGQFPTYNAGTYDAIYIWKEAVERAGSLDPDAIVPELEATDYLSAPGRVVFDATHDVTWGPGFVTGIGTQWQNGQLVCVWPDNWQGITYEGTVPYQLPPWVRGGP